MKKLLLILLSLPTILTAATMRHFNITVDDANISETQVVKHFSEWYNLPSNSTFVQSKVQTDNNGYTHYCYNQYVGGVPVEGGQILVHAQNGMVQDINGIILETETAASPVTNKIVQKRSVTNDTKDILIIPIENETDFRYAYKIVSENLGAYVYVDAEKGDTLKIIPYNYNAQTKFTTNTMYYGRQQLTGNASGKWRYFSVQDPGIETILATEVNFSNASASVYYDQIQACNTYYEQEADSLNSYIVSITYELIKGADAWWHDLEEGVGNNEYPDLYLKITNSSGQVVYQSLVYDDWKSYGITFNPMLPIDGSQYTVALYDEDVVSDDYAGAFTISSTTKGIGTLSMSNFNVTVNVSGNPIRDIHWGMEKTLAYYKNVHNLNSYDGKGSTIYQFVNPIDTFQGLPLNAYSRNDYPYCLVYGLGDGIHYSPYAALDIIAHEFTHMATFHSTISGLVYEGESGALNEGFSDIFGILVEGYTLGQYDWTIGEKTSLKYPYMRSLKNPNSGEAPHQPTTYGKGTWINPLNTAKENDYGGVHRNSSILSHMFYLLSQGGSGVNDNQQSYKVQGVGIEKATKITYNTWMNRLTGHSTFADARESFIKEVMALYGKGSQEHQSVVNAWHAVGVGDKYIEEAPEPDNYVILAQRDAASNWFYMTSDLGSAGTKRYQAVDAGTPSLENVNTSNLDSKYYWQVEDTKLHTAVGYSTWTAGNSATLDNTGKDLSIEKQTDGTYIFSFIDGDNNTRRLALNKDSRNNYFAYYKGQDQIYKLTLIKEGEVWKPENIEFVTKQPSATKILRNGQILILRGNHTYTLTGQEVK